MAGHGPLVRAAVISGDTPSPVAGWCTPFTKVRTRPANQRTCMFLAGSQDHGLTINGPIREVYPNDPREVPPEEILTEIYIPVR